jgi:putative redox protein
MAKSVVRIEGNSEGMKTEVKAANHTVIIDEPEKMGGQDQGPDPLSTMLGALAGCENVIANLVAKEMVFDLQSIQFEVKGDIDFRGLMGDPTVKPYFTKVEVHAKVKTSENEERLKELQEKTDARCPIYTTLQAAGIELVPNWELA